MARYRVTGPDGGTFEVNAPDDATQEQVMAYVQQNAGQSQGAAKFAQPAMATAEPKANPVPLGDAIADVGKSAAIGAAQGAIGMATLPGNVEGLARAGINYGAGALGIEAPFDSDTILTNYNDLKKRVEGITGEFYKPQTTVGKYARTVGEFAGGAGALGAVNRGARAINAAVPLARAPTAAGIAVPAVASEAAGQLTEGTSLEPWARVAGAMAGTMAPNVAARMVTPAPSAPARANAIQTLENEGVTALTAGQRTGNEFLRWVEDATAMAPMGGRRAAIMQNQADEQFTAAALRRAGINAERADAQTMNQAFATIGREYDTFGQNVVMTANPGFNRRMTDIAGEYTRNAPQSSIRQGVPQLAREIIAAASQPGGLTGRQLTNYRSVMRELQRNARNDPDASQAIGRMVGLFDAQMVRNAPTPAARAQLRVGFRDLNRRYRNMLAIERAAGAAGEGAANGIISPAALRTAVKASNLRSYATGRHPMADLARSGVSGITPLRSSGTAERTMAQNIVATPSAMASGAAGAIASGGDPTMMILAALGPAAIKAATARGIMSRPVQGYLGNQMIPQQIDAIDPRLPALLSQFMLSRED